MEAEAPNEGLLGITVVAAAAAAAISVVAVVEDAAPKGFAAMYFALVDSVTGSIAMIEETFVEVVPAVVAAAFGGCLLVLFVADTASPVVIVSTEAELNSYYLKECFVGIGHSLLIVVAAELEST